MPNPAAIVTRSVSPFTLEEKKYRHTADINYLDSDATISYRLTAAQLDSETDMKPSPRKAAPRPAVTAKGQRILRLPSVMDKTGLSRATVYRRFGHMRIQLGPNSAGWLESDIDAWITERIAASRASAAAAE